MPLGLLQSVEPDRKALEGRVVLGKGSSLRCMQLKGGKKNDAERSNPCMEV